MNPQFFLDARDFSKYRLLQQLATCPGIQRLTIVWMLTSLAPPQGHGSKKHIDDPEFPELTAFFADRGAHRSIREVPDYYRGQGIECHAYGDDRPFSMQSRDKYFSGIPGEWLRSAVVFFDPDNGMAPRHVNEKHLRFEELRGVWERMDEPSIVCVIQFPRRQSGAYAQIAQELAGSIPGAHVAWLKESGIAFFLLAKSSRGLDDVRERRTGLISVAEPATEWPGPVRQAPPGRRSGAAS